jgi:hypothetical protein
MCLGILEWNSIRQTQHNNQASEHSEHHDEDKYLVPLVF